MKERTQQQGSAATRLRRASEALRPLLTDPALRAAYRGRALAASGRFTRAVLARETLALYARAIAAAQARPGGRASVPQSR